MVRVSDPGGADQNNESNSDNSNTMTNPVVANGDDSSSSSSSVTKYNHVSPASSSSRTNPNKYSAAPLFDRSESCGSEGSLFFADMTLDLSLAATEATPRTDKLFASLVAENPGRGVGVIMRGADTDAATERGDTTVRDDDDDHTLLRNVPPMPLLSDATSLHMEEGATTRLGSGIANYHMHAINNQTDCDEHDEEANNNNYNNIITSPLHYSHCADDYPLQNNHSKNKSGSNNSNSTHLTNAISSNSNNSNTQRHVPLPPRRPPRRPRDVSYTILACVVLPTGLLLPHLYYPNEYILRHNEKGSTNSTSNVSDNNTNRNNQYSWSQMAMSSTSHSTILFSTLIATLLSLLLTRLLYNQPAGGNGNDKRHAYIGRIILTSSHLCIWLYPTLAMYIWVMLPNARKGRGGWGIITLVLPLGMLVRDASFRMKGPSPALRMRHHDGGGRGGRVSSSSSHADRRTFFRVLAVAALDIVSRSLRRKSFVRTISVLLIMQFVVVSLWWGALSVVLSVKVYEDDAMLAKLVHVLWLLITLTSGKWATDITARLIGYVTSGGVASWFGSQTTLIMERMKVEEEERRIRRSRQKPPQSTPNKVLETISENDDSNTEDNGDHRAYLGGKYSMPEAYRTASASAYAPVMDFDEEFVCHDDDDDADYNDDDDDSVEQRDNRRSGSTSASSQKHTSLSSKSSTTVKSFLAAGCTISFGSVAQCGLLGNLAQMLWSFVRNINAMEFFLQRFHPQSNSGSHGFRGMNISTDGSTVVSTSQRWKYAISEWWRTMDATIRSFVCSHSDLAMSHVAMYYKSYQMAAKDVAALIETSGT